MHDKIRAALTGAGFKHAEIAVINGFTKSGGTISDTQLEKERSNVVDDFNAGKYKILIGTTGCIGEGLNLQENSSAIHHFDIPFRPSDFIQRNGRVDRQGNAQDKVRIHTYMSAGTIDNYSVNLVQNKANWIDELLNSKTNVFTNPDEESGVDADELLLALTEEWGDASKAEERRAEMKRTAALKLAEGEEKKRRDFTASLTKMRGALPLFRGDIHSFAYQQRLKKIELIEKSLLAMPSFKSPEIIGGKTPFLYSRKHDQIIMSGDLVYRYNHAYTVTDLDVKKQKYSIYALNKDEFSKDTAYLLSSNHPVNDLTGKDDGFVHLPTPEVVNLYRLINKEAFYSLKDESLKEQYYVKHLDTYEGYKTVFKYKDGDVFIARERYIYNAPAYLNPFRQEDIDKIKAANHITFGSLRNDAKELTGEKQEALSFVKRSIPGLFTVLSDKLPATPPLFDAVIRDKQNTPAAFRDNLALLCVYLYYKKDPIRAAKTILEHTPDEYKPEINKLLISRGCVDGKSTAASLARWSSAEAEHKCNKNHVQELNYEQR
jgi:hypothetical protein